MTTNFWNRFSKKPTLDHKFTYKHENYPNKIELTYGDIKGRRNFQPLPKQKSNDFQIYKRDWEVFFNKIKFDTMEQQGFVFTLNDKYKHRILQVHYRISQGDKKYQCKIIQFSNVEKRVRNLQNNVTHGEVQQFRLWLEQNAEDDAWNEFLQLEGPKILIDILEIEEIKSRQSKQYQTVLELLKLILDITTFQDGIEIIGKIPRSIEVLTQCYHPVHIEITTYLCEILDKFIWLSDEYIDRFLSGLHQYKVDKQLNYRFQTFVDTIRDSSNVVFIETIIGFLCNLIKSPSDQWKGNYLKKELEELNIGKIFDIVKLKIRLNLYKIEDCSNDSVNQKLKQWKNKDQKSLTREQYNKQIVSILEDLQLQYKKEGKMSVEDNNELKTIPEEQALRRQDTYDFSDEEEQGEVIVEEYSDQGTPKDLDEEEKSTDTAQMNMTNNSIDQQNFVQLKLYLQNNELTSFEDHKKQIMLLIRFFREFGLKDEERNMLQSLVCEPEKKVLDINQLMQQVKDKALKEADYELFCKILENLLKLPESTNNQGQSSWIQLQSILKDYKELNYLLELKEKKPNLQKEMKQIEDQEYLAQQLKKLEEEKSNLLTEIQQLVKDNNEYKLSTQQLQQQQKINQAINEQQMKGDEILVMLSALGGDQIKSVTFLLDVKLFHPVDIYAVLKEYVQDLAMPPYCTEAKNLHKYIKHVTKKNQPQQIVVEPFNKYIAFVLLKYVEVSNSKLDAHRLRLLFKQQIEVCYKKDYKDSQCIQFYSKVNSTVVGKFQKYNAFYIKTEKYLAQQQQSKVKEQPASQQQQQPAQSGPNASDAAKAKQEPEWANPTQEMMGQQSDQPKNAKASNPQFSKFLEMKNNFMQQKKLSAENDKLNEQIEQKKAEIEKSIEAQTSEPSSKQQQGTLPDPGIILGIDLPMSVGEADTSTEPTTQQEIQVIVQPQAPQLSKFELELQKKQQAQQNKALAKTQQNESDKGKQASNQSSDQNKASNEAQAAQSQAPTLQVVESGSSNQPAKSAMQLELEKKMQKKQATNSLQEEMKKKLEQKSSQPKPEIQIISINSEQSQPSLAAPKIEIISLNATTNSESGPTLNAPNIMLPGMGGLEAPNIMLPGMGGLEAPNIMLPGMGGLEAPNIMLPGMGGLEAPNIQLPGMGGLEAPNIQLPGMGGLEAPNIMLPGMGGLDAPNIELPGMGGLGAPNIELPGMGGLQAPNFILPDMNFPVARVKPKIIPKVSMKMFMWSPVDECRINNTIWDKIDDTKIKIDIDFLESQFSKPAEKSAAGNKGTQQKPAEPEAVAKKTSLLNAKRAQNIEIILQKLKMSYPLIANALLTGDEKILTLSNLSSLALIAPKDEEISMIKQHVKIGNDPKLLQNADQFILESTKVNRFLTRVNAFKFKLEFQEYHDLLSNNVRSLLTGFENLLKNTKIQGMLEYVLAIGNYLNGNTSRGGAWAFEISSLEKLNDLKASDNKQTLLMHVIDKIEEQYKEDIVTQQEYEEWKLMCSKSVEQQTNELKELQMGLSQMEIAIRSQSSLEVDQIKAKLEGPYQEMSAKVNTLKQQLQQLDETYKKCAEFYCEDPTEASDNFGKKFFSFAKQVEKCKEMKKKLEVEMKKEKQKREVEEAKKQKSKPDQALRQSKIILQDTVNGQKLSEIPGVISKQISNSNQYSSQFRMSKSQLGLRESFVLAKNMKDISRNLKEKMLNKQQAQQQNHVDDAMEKILEQQD